LRIKEFIFVFLRRFVIFAYFCGL